MASKCSIHNERFCDIEPDPHRRLSPIQGYADKPLVPLEEAVEPLISLVHDVKRMAKSAKWQCSDSPPNNLTEEQSAAVRLYSMEWEPRDQCLYFVLNATLRDKNRQKLKPWFLYLKLFLTALARLPTVKRTIYRGVRGLISNDYRKSENVIWWGFSSCTMTMDVLDNEQFLGMEGPRTIFAIECMTGKDIRQHSTYRNEDEILLPAARQFRVVSHMHPGSNLSIVQLEEIQGDFELIDFEFESDEIISEKTIENDHSPSESPKSTDKGGSSWNERIQILQKYSINHAGIFGADGTEWATSANFPKIDDFPKVLQKVFSEDNPQGLIVDGQKFIVIRLIDQSAMLRRGTNAMIVTRTKRAYIIAISYDDRPERFAEIMRKMGAFFEDTGF